MDSATGTRVALRAITEPLGSEQRQGLVDALRRLCERPLDHPSIARPLDCGVEGEVPYLVHAQLPGRTVDEYLAAMGPRPLSEVALRLTHLAAAIDYAAAAGVHHGAINPGDVVFGPDSSGLAGFGVVQALREAGATVNEPTTADDIYALAAMTYELLAGRAYTGGDVAEAVAGLAVGERYDRRALTAALESALSPDPARWPSTALQFAGALHDAQLVEPVMGRLVFDDDAIGPGPTESPLVAAPGFEPEPARFMDAVPPVSDLAPATDHAGRLIFDAPLYASDAAEMPTVIVARPHHLARASTAVLDHVSEAEGVDEDAPLHPAGDPVGRRVEPARPPFIAHDQVSHGARVAVAVSLVALLLAGAAGIAWVLLSAPPDVSSASSDTGAGTESPPPRIQVDGDAIGAAGAPDRGVPPAGGAPAPVPDGSAPPPPPSPPAPAAPPAPRIASSDPAGRAAIRQGREARPDPAPASGRVLVRSNPPGAQVLVDGEPHGVTPLAIRGLALGSHTIAVSAPGYPVWQQRVTLTAAQPAQSFDLALGDGAGAAAAPAVEGALVIDSRPAGAQVWMDGALVGTTPLVVSGVGAGAHAVRIELPGYRPWSTSVQVNRGERARVAASLEH